MSRNCLQNENDIINFLAKPKLALCGNGENDISINRGHFLELVHLIVKSDVVFREYLKCVAKF